MAVPEAKNSASQTSWSKTFPVDLEGPAQSKEFAYRFVLITSAMILERRKILPENCFKARNIEKLIIPSYNLENQLAKRVKTKIEGLKHAIENGFLDEFAIVIYKKPDEEDIIEVFSFKFQYKENNSISVSLGSTLHNEEAKKNLLDFEFVDFETARSQFIKIMKTLHRYMTKALDKLPDDVDGSFRVSYTSKAPENYTPAGFTLHTEFYKFDSSKDVSEMGIIGGGYHAIQILGASLLRKANIADFNKTIASIDDSFSVQSKSLKRAESPKMRTDNRRFGNSHSFTRNLPLRQKQYDIV